MKGMIYTLEAILGALIILVGIVIIFPIRQQPVSLSDVGRSCLVYLDNNGLLRHYAVSNMSAELGNGLRNCLPSVADFYVKVCTSPDCIGALPSGKDVYLSSYVIAGDDEYDSRFVNLWVWFK